MMAQLLARHMNLDIKILRRMWRFVETSNPYTIIKQSDEEIVHNLIRQVESISPLPSEDINLLAKYISARTALIRDLAQSKLVMS